MGTGIPTSTYGICSGWRTRASPGGMRGAVAVAVVHRVVRLVEDERETRRPARPVARQPWVARHAVARVEQSDRVEQAHVVSRRERHPRARVARVVRPGRVRREGAPDHVSSARQRRRSSRSSWSKARSGRRTCATCRRTGCRCTSTEPPGTRVRLHVVLPRLVLVALAVDLARRHEGLMFRVRHQ